MCVAKLSTLIIIIPLTTKLFVRCEESVSKVTIPSTPTTPYKLSTKSPAKSPMLSTITNILRQDRTFAFSGSTAKFTGRTPPYRNTVPNQCDYIINHCHKTYDTSAVCGRTLQYQYQSFKNYCMLDFVNCREGHEIWQILHMGKCYKLKDLTENEEFLYSGDSFLSKDYVIDRHQWKLQDMPRYVQERDQ
ncbi:uncharacterized protein LOC118270500 isoform X1 [Spodoptera frugiperda]|uniref:Uncharacterized protein LOC118270500 isoform X1 n=1 Tax=Spodoptera frugiperda TaxID=7108 RepID=A0A9R0DUL6_SPOFR|nr:uncharacterized protein LOC118270500 isoform X1 [Spodoptera frugiperda]